MLIKHQAKNLKNKKDASMETLVKNIRMVHAKINTINLLFKINWSILRLSRIKVSKKKERKINITIKEIWVPKQEKMERKKRIRAIKKRSKALNKYVSLI